MRLASVRVRVTAAAVVLTAVALGVGAWGLVRAVEHTQIARLARDVDEQVRVVATRLQEGIPPPEALIPGEPGVVSFSQIIRGDDVVAAAGVGGVTRSAPAHAAVEPEILLGATNDSSGRTTVVFPGPGEEAVDVQFQTQQVEVNGDVLTVAVASPLTEVRRSLDALQRNLWIGLPLLVALVGALAWQVTGRALQPVEAMRAEVEAISHSTLHRRVPAPVADDEIGRLAVTMNSMLDRLESAAERQRRFVSDASHELRSPIAAMRAELEVALSTARGEGDLRSAIRGALAEEARLEELLANLLVLASVDEGVHLPDTEVDLADLAAAEAAIPRRVPVTASGAGVVRGSATQLRRVVTNLVDNAARHAATAVSISVDGGRLTVDDDGFGIPEADRERIFERFTRLDEARARDDGGAGLGLALVRSVAVAHGGRAWAEESPIGGGRLVVDLPTA